MKNNKKLVLKNGAVFEGIGEPGIETIGEVVFNTSMVGYQEIITDPSYYDQIIVMTYPLIGNYGINDEDNESKDIYIKGFAVKEYNDIPSNFRSTKTLHDTLKEKNVPLISNVETRSIAKIIRDHGTMIGMITDIDKPLGACLDQLKTYLSPAKQTSKVSAKKIVLAKTVKPKYNVVLIDFGTKSNIVRMLNQKKCNVTIVPYNIAPKEVLDLKPDGIFLSNGPGDPIDNNEAIHLIQTLKGKIPIAGICLGHQIIALAYGAKTYKMKFGHRGSNHPIKNLETNKIEITAQNHSYAVDEKTLGGTNLKVTHINLLDNTIEGLKNDEESIFSIQYHPESSAGPEDSVYLFDYFIELMEKFKHAKTHRHS